MFKFNISFSRPYDDRGIPMDLIDKEDLELLNNKRVLGMKPIDWGKTMAVPNQYIQRNILRHMLRQHGWSVYTSDDDDLPDINIANNSPGFDLLVVTHDNKHIRIQSKLRQVTGKDDCSKQTHFETTRRNSSKNENKNHTGQVCYDLDEFDFVMISLVNIKNNRDKIKNCDLWTYCLIPVKDLIDPEHNCCCSSISSVVLKKNVIKLSDDIMYKFHS